MVHRCEKSGVVKNKQWFCHAVWRTHYPFGKNSKARTSFLIKHNENCPLNKKQKRNKKG